MAKKKEKKAGKRMKKKELVKVLLEFFHTKQDEVLSLKYIFEQLHLTTHPLKMLCMDILSELSMDDYITEVDKHKYKLNNHGVEMTGTFQRKSNGKNSFIPEGGGEPIFVAERNSAHAMNNDKSAYRLLCQASRTRSRRRSHRDTGTCQRHLRGYPGSCQVIRFPCNGKPYACQQHLHPQRKVERRQDGRQSHRKGGGMARQSQEPHRPGNRHPGARKTIPPRCTPSWRNSACPMSTPLP